MVVFAIECRKAPEYSYPAQVIDVNYATRWIKAHATDYNAIPESLGSLATSCGRHSLFLSAMLADDDRYNTFNLAGNGELDAMFSYLIGAWPILDPYGRYLFAQHNNLDFLMQATDSYFFNHDEMREENPLFALNHGELPILPPALIIQGTADKNLPLSSIDLFVEAYRAAGGEVKLELFANQPHGFACKTCTESDRAIEIIKDFVNIQVAANKPSTQGHYFSG